MMVAPPSQTDVVSRVARLMAIVRDSPMGKRCDDVLVYHYDKAHAVVSEISIVEGNAGVSFLRGDANVYGIALCVAAEDVLKADPDDLERQIRRFELVVKACAEEERSG